MLDRHVHIQHANSTANVTVTEKRAPTDESVRLLKEMEQAARDRIVQSIRLENSPIDCVVHHQVDAMSGDFQMAAILKINGKRIEAKATVSQLADMADPMELAIAMRDEVAKAIANEVLATAFARLAPHLRKP